jgi:hypothetical protein
VRATLLADKPVTTPLVVGLPCHRRQWCLDRWFDSVEAQDLPEGTRFLFILSEQGDPSERIILRRRPDAEILYAEGLPSFGEDEKDDPSRYVVLAHLRNQLLRRVCSIEPDYYLSWDSDIILEPNAYWALRGVVDQGDGAVGALVDMGGEVYPGNWSWMRLEGTDAIRPLGLGADGLPLLRSPGGVFPFPVGVIMGVKLMTPRAYRDVRYADHVLGEDVGWAIQAEAMGVERWVCPAARGEHLYRIA